MADSSDDARERRWWTRIYDLIVCGFGKWLWTAVIVTALVSGAIAWAFTPWKTDFSKYPVGSIFPWLRDHLSAFLVAGACLFAILALLAVLRRRTGHALKRPQAIPLTRENRRRLLTRLHSLYQTAIEQSLWGVARIELGLERTFEATAHPALLVSYRPAGARHNYAPDTPILDIYKGAGDGLLILGKPGAGKSTLLYDLALALVTRAERDPAQPLPILVALSSWAVKRLPLEQWLAEELVLRYQIPRGLAIGWLLTDQLLPLLDGLDEMAEESRSVCIEAINAYRQRHPLPLVVCSRSEEYFTQKRQLQLQSAIEVQPLTKAQIQHYLAAGKHSLEAVRVVLDQNPTLQELLTTPLLLSVVILAYQGKTKNDLPQLRTAEAQQHQIFASYIQRMLERPVARGQFTQEQTCRWLTWLAQQMQQHQLTEFYLEHLQLNWLPTLQAQRRFSWLNRLLVALLGGLLGGLLAGLFFGLISGLVFGLISGLLFGLGSRLPDTDVRPTETLSWSWSVIRRKPFVTWSTWLVGGLIIGVLNGLLLGVLSGLVSGLLYVLGYGLLSGLSGAQLDEHLRLKPNQGIQRSGGNALRAALIVGLGFGLVGGLFVRSGYWLGLGLNSGLLSGLAFGGTAYLTHYTLRFLLWRSGLMPWHYVHFLDEATQRILLHRVGGGYRFIHPLFQEYFASGAATASPVTGIK